MGNEPVGSSHPRSSPPSTQFFGIDQPGDIATITMAYQIAQKLHACTDPHDPPHFAQLRVATSLTCTSSEGVLPRWRRPHRRARRSRRHLRRPGRKSGRARPDTTSVAGAPASTWRPVWPLRPTGTTQTPVPPRISPFVTVSVARRFCEVAPADPVAISVGSINGMVGSRGPYASACGERSWGCKRSVGQQMTGAQTRTRENEPSGRPSNAIL